MDEKEWLNSEDPRAMLTFATGDGSGLGDGPNSIPVSKRKLSLFCIACCYHVSRQLGKDAEKCLEWGSGPAKDPANWAGGWAGDHSNPDRVRKADLLRDIIGNPWQTISECDIYATMNWREAAQVLTIAENCWEQTLPDGTLDPFGLLMLAEALEEAGCDNDVVLRHLRGQKSRACCRCLGTGNCQHCQDGYIWVQNDAPHVRDCHVLDLLIGKS